MRDFDNMYEEDSEEEPSFSFHDFKKWLAKQKQPKTVSESVEENTKDKLKSKFKKHFKDRLRKDEQS